MIKYILLFFLCFLGNFILKSQNEYYFIKVNFFNSSSIKKIDSDKIISIFFAKTDTIALKSDSVICLKKPINGTKFYLSYKIFEISINTDEYIKYANLCNDTICFDIWLHPNNKANEWVGSYSCSDVDYTFYNNLPRKKINIWKKLKILLNITTVKYHHIDIHPYYYVPENYDFKKKYKINVE